MTFFWVVDKWSSMWKKGMKVEYLFALQARAQELVEILTDAGQVVPDELLKMINPSNKKARIGNWGKHLHRVSLCWPVLIYSSLCSRLKWEWNKKDTQCSVCQAWVSASSTRWHFAGGGRGERDGKKDKKPGPKLLLLLIRALEMLVTRSKYDSLQVPVNPCWLFCSNIIAIIFWL